MINPSNLCHLKMETKVHEAKLQSDRTVETTERGFPVGESTFTEWTNERHSLYLNFMEASFVNQLYRHKNSSMNLLGWCSGKNISLHTNECAHGHISSSQFKVHQNSRWQKINSERDQPKLGTSDESRIVPESPSFQDFRSAQKFQSMTCLQQREGSTLATEVHLGRRKRDCNGLTASSTRPLASLSDLCDQNSVSHRTEMSDQNFVNQESEEEKLTNLCREKRMKRRVANVSNEYQVVPSGKFPLAVNSKREVYFQEDRSTSSLSPESKKY